MQSESELLKIPTPSESVGFTDRAPKTASLLFDRVVTMAREPCPAPIGFDAFTHDRHVEDHTARTVDYEINFDGEDISVVARDIAAPQPENLYAGRHLDAALASFSNSLLRVGSEELRLKLGLDVYPMYHSVEAYSAEYKPGNYGVIIASLENLKIVHEDAMDWEQIMDFRNDKDARRKYRRMVHWLNGSMVGKSQSFIQDELAIRIEDYESALQKHGLKTLLGTLSDILDPKVLIAATTVGGALFQVDSLLGVLAGSGVTLANVVVKAARNALDLKSSMETSRGQIAYVFELRERFG